MSLEIVEKSNLCWYLEDGILHKMQVPSLESLFNLKWITNMMDKSEYSFSFKSSHGASAISNLFKKLLKNSAV